MDIKFVDSVYLEALKEHKNFSSDVKFFQEIKNQLLFKYGEVEKEQFYFKYSEEGWLGRKITALPKAAWSGLIHSTYHLALAILIGIPAVFKGEGKYLIVQLFSFARDLQCAYGYLTSLINDRYGQFHIQESQFQKSCYHYFLAYDLTEKEKVTSEKKQGVITSKQEEAKEEEAKLQELKLQEAKQQAAKLQEVKQEETKIDEAEVVIPLETVDESFEEIEKWCKDKTNMSAVKERLIAHNVKNLKDLIALSEAQITLVTDGLKTLPKKRFLIELDKLKHPQPSVTSIKKPPLPPLAKNNFLTQPFSKDPLLDIEVEDFVGPTVNDDELSLEELQTQYKHHHSVVINYNNLIGDMKLSNETKKYMTTLKARSQERGLLLAKLIRAKGGIVPSGWGKEQEKEAENKTMPSQTVKFSNVVKKYTIENMDGGGFITVLVAELPL